MTPFQGSPVRWNVSASCYNVGHPSFHSVPPKHRGKMMEDDQHREPGAGIRKSSRTNVWLWVIMAVTNATAFTPPNQNRGVRGGGSQELATPLINYTFHFESPPTPFGNKRTNLWECFEGDFDADEGAADHPGRRGRAAESAAGCRTRPVPWAASGDPVLPADSPTDFRTRPGPEGWPAGTRSWAGWTAGFGCEKRKEKWNLQKGCSEATRNPVAPEKKSFYSTPLGRKRNALTEQYTPSPTPKKNAYRCCISGIISWDCWSALRHSKKAASSSCYLVVSSS